MKQDRFLLGILVFIGLIVVAAVALFFVRGAGQEYRPEDSPEAIVHNYALALTRGDYEKAYSYLAEAEGKPSLADFRSNFTPFDPFRNTGLRVGSSEILEGEAFVDVSIVYGSSGPFDSGSSYSQSARVLEQEGRWMVRRMPYPFWNDSWYNDLERP